MKMYDNQIMKGPLSFLIHLIIWKSKKPKKKLLVLQGDCSGFSMVISHFSNKMLTSKTNKGNKQTCQNYKDENPIECFRNGQEYENITCWRDCFDKWIIINPSLLLSQASRTKRTDYWFSSYSQFSFCDEWLFMLK